MFRPLGKQPKRPKGLKRYLEDRAKWKTFDFEKEMTYKELGTLDAIAEKGGRLHYYLIALLNEIS
jgi:hypothetical protein